jgi:hypothetical protein
VESYQCLSTDLLINFRLFNSPVSSSHYTASKSRINKQWKGKAVEWSGCGLIGGTNTELAWMDWEKPWETSVRIVKCPDWYVNQASVRYMSEILSPEFPFSVVSCSLQGGHARTTDVTQFSWTQRCYTSSSYELTSWTDLLRYVQRAYWWHYSAIAQHMSIKLTCYKLYYFMCVKRKQQNFLCQHLNHYCTNDITNEK